MALDPTTGQPIDPYQWPPPEWQQPGPLDLASTLGPRGTGSTIDPVPPPPPPPPPLPGELSKHQYIGPTLAESGGEEVPQSPGSLPDVDPMADADPRLDATPDELAAKPAPPQLGEFPPMQVGQGAGDIHPFSIGGQVEKAASDYSKLPEAQQDEVQINQAADQLGARTPADRELVRQGYLGLKQQDQQHKDTAKLIQDDLQRQQEAYATFQKSQMQAQQDLAEIDAQAKKIGQVDPNHYASTLGTGQKVLGILAAITGGLTASAPYGNGQNVGLDMLNKAVERDVEAQKYNINARIQQLGMARNSVAERLNLAAEAYKSEEIHRQALYQSAITKLQTDAQNFDPAGSTATRIGGFIQQIQARKDAAMLDTQTKLAKLRLDQANASKAEADALKTQYETAKIAGTLGGAGKPDVDFSGQYASLNDIPPKLHDRAYRLPSGAWAIAPSQPAAAEATTFVKQYKQLDYNLNELQKLSIEREGAKSAGGSFSDKWKTDDEQHYKQLLTDAVNRYGMMIHGRAPTAGVLEEVLHSFPDFKSAWERGDTTYLLGKMRDDVDNRGTLELSAYGANEKLKTPRPKPAVVNVNTLSAPLLEKPVKGDAGFARFDVSNGNAQLNAISQQYIDNPRLSESEPYGKFLDRIKGTQEANAEQIRREVDALSKKQKRTADEEQRLANDAKALADREELIKAIVDAKARNTEAERARAQAEANKKKDALERPAAGVPAHFEKL